MKEKEEDIILKAKNIKPSSAASEDSIMSLGSDDGNFDNIHVVVRVRPLTRQEEGRKDIQAVQFPAEGQIALDDHTTGAPRVFTFHVVFEPEASQEEVFDHCGIKRLIDMALDG
ncbi:kinesin motor domain-containing protein [Trichonephila clavata]|uniref:Kinesin motor domain-containing protein n=1 Tax=Trichonephila clavata TaxID=2740835 RepID=A0A8X6JYX5_TRICU|nr:kinesin motor domain-containing protein [Trichonephila clavata]